MPLIQYGDATINYRDDGEGQPVLAIHGSASTSYQWESLTGYLAGRFRVVRPDLPGYGKSTVIGRPHGLAEIAERLVPLFGELREPFHLVGHSFGGTVALKIARMFPHLVRSLVVIEPASFHLLKSDADNAQRFGEIQAVAARVRSACFAGDHEKAMAGFIDFWNGKGAWERTSEGLRQKLQLLSEQVLDDFNAIAGESSTFADYAEIECPTLAVTGRKSPAVTQFLTERLSAVIPMSVFEEIRDSGHMAPLTDPHIVDPMIAAHIVFAQGVQRHGGDYRIAA